MKALNLVLLLTHLIPVLITELILRSCTFLSEKEKRIGTFINLVINAVFFLVVMTLLYRTNPITQIKNLLTLNCSYQDIARFGVSNLLCLLVPVLVWFFYRREIRKRGECSARFEKKGVVLLLFSFVLFTAVLSWYGSLEGNKSITLSGVCRKTTLIDEEEEETEVSYVAVRNEGQLANEVKNLYVSDNEDELLYARLAEGKIGPGESLTTYFTADDSVNMRKNGGSWVLLSDGSGNILDRITLPALQEEEACVKTGEEWLVIDLTRDNAVISSPVFSSESGFYDTAFDLTLSSEKGMKIYYTLDCTDPTTESALYTGPIHVYDKSAEENRFRSIQNVETEYLERENVDPGPVDKAFIVRAIAADEAGNLSKPVTKSYFIGLDKYKDLKVVSLVTDPANLFDSEKGIYVTGAEYDEWYRQYLDGKISLPEGESKDSASPDVNFRKRGEAWERKANCELIHGSEVLLNQPIGLRVQGDSSSVFPLKRFSVYSRKKYGTDRFFDQPVLGEFNTHAMVVRNGFLNAFTPMLVQDRAAAVQRSVPAAVFVEGEFWYYAYLQEKYVSSYFSEHYGVNSDNIIREERLLYSGLLDEIAEFDASLPEGYAKIGEHMDIQSYIDFTCINAYLNNEDTYDEKNLIMWKCPIPEGTGYDDGRWRWGLYDMDLMWHLRFRDHPENEPAYAVNPFTLGVTSGWEEPFAIHDQQLFNKLKPSREFQKQFVLTFMDLVNTDFRPDVVLPELEAFEDWGEATEEHYEFFEKRPEYIVPCMAEEFALTGTSEPVILTSDRPDAVIILNTINPDLKNGSWTGQYYTDYPVSVSTNESGFDHWEITANGTTETRTEPSIEVPVAKGGTVIHAVFQ